MKNELRIEGEAWSLEDGRCIVTPDGRFNLTYGTEKGSGRALFPDFCKLDRIAVAVSALPELLAALQIAKHYADCCDMATADEKCREDLAVINAAIAKALGHE